MKKKWFSIIVIFLLVISADVNAEEVRLRSVNVAKGYATKRKGDISYYGPIEYFYFDNKIAYCLEGNIRINGSIYQKQIHNDYFSQSLLKEIETIAYYGYEYLGHQSLEYYMATQELIWRVLHIDDVIWSSEPLGKGTIYNIEPYKKEIERLISLHHQIPEFHIPTTQQVGYTYGLAFDHQIEDFQVTANHSIVTKKNHDFYIEAKESGQETIIITRKSYKDKNSYIYKRSGSQTLGVFGMSNIASSKYTYEILPPIQANIKLNIIEKNSQTVLPTEEYVFRIFDVSKNQYVSENNTTEFIINQDGYLNISPLKEGKYYIECSQLKGHYQSEESIISFEVINRNDIVINYHVMPILYSVTLHTTGPLLNEEFHFVNQTIDFLNYQLYAKEDILDYQNQLIYKKGYAIKKVPSTGQIVDLYPGSYCINFEKNLQFTEKNFCFVMTQDMNLNLTLDRLLQHVEGRVQMELNHSPIDRYFHILTSQDNTIDDIFIPKGTIFANFSTSDDTFLFDIPNMPYQIVDKNIPLGYDREYPNKIYQNESYIILNYHKKKYQLTIFNKIKNKFTEEGTYAIYDHANNLVARNTFNHSNISLLPGKYEVVLEKTKLGYRPIQSRYQIDLSTDETVVFDNLSLTMPNTSTEIFSFSDLLLLGGVLYVAIKKMLSLFIGTYHQYTRT